MPETWREQLKNRCASINETAVPVVSGLLTKFTDRRTCRLGREALEAAPASMRQAIWAMVFPAIQAEVEIAWNELSMQVVARRDGGIEGSGDRFTWPASQPEASEHRFTWLRKLLIITGPDSSLGLPELLVKAAEYKGQKWDSESGHCFDDDAPAYLAVPILNRGGPLADECMDVLSRSQDGTHPQGRFGRHVMTALLCCERPDAWALVNGHLANAGLDQGFRERLMWYREGVHPDAWRHFLRTVVEHRLWRYEAVKNRLSPWLGIQWNWKAQSGLEGWVRMWAELQENETLRAEKLGRGDPGDLFLALHALAKEDGPAAIREVQHITKEENTDRRIACGFFLSICPAEQRTACLGHLTDDKDPRVATVAVRTLASNPHRPSLPEDFSRRLESLLKHRTEKMAATPDPFPEITPDRDEIIELMVNCLKEGDEERMLPWLAELTVRARQMLITKCNRMTQTAVQRTILFKLMRDSNPEVAQHAIKAARAIPLSAEEIADVESMLALKQTERRLLLVDLLMRQPSQTVIATTKRLIEASKLEQRLAGYELMRRLVSQEELRPQIAGLVTQAGARQSLSQDDRNHLEEIKAALGLAKEESPPTPANAFGLVDPASLPSYPPPQDRGVMLHSPNTVILLQEMDALVTQNLEVEFQTLDYQRQPKLTNIRQSGVPYTHRDLSLEDDRQSFPLLHVWEQWWQNRPQGKRDPDGFELERMAVLLSVPECTSPEGLMLVCGVSSLPKWSNKNNMQKLVGLLRKRFVSANWRHFVLCAAEQALFVVSQGTEIRPAYSWFEFANSQLCSRISGATEEPSVEDMLRYWQLVRRPQNPRVGQVYLRDVLKAFVRGVISDNEFIWWLLGGTEMSAAYTGRQFDDFGQCMWSDAISRCAELQHPRVIEVIDRCRQRVVEVELKRGEAVQDSSHAARRITHLRGASQLIRVLVALGSADLRRVQRSNDYSRASVFSHLICVCHPAQDDSAASFADAWKPSGVSRERLIEVSVLAPQWAYFIGHAIGVPRLKDAVEWIHAHTKTSEWQWQTKTREMWAGELSRLTPLPAAELLEGAVDVTWFQRAYAAVGNELWNQLYAAAKFACSGAGHSRARMFADALLGEVTATELATSIQTKGHQDAVRSIGLVPLPKDAKKRKTELIERYRILAAFRHGSAKSKAQKRASEETACRIGMQNLARAAGHEDPVRFAWAMETEEAKDLAGPPPPSRDRRRDCHAACHAFWEN